MDERCENCRFWKLHGGVMGIQYGQCRRKTPDYQIPPPMLPSPDNVTIPPAAIFPLSLNFEWCGEYQKGDTQ